MPTMRADLHQRPDEPFTAEPCTAFCEAPWTTVYEDARADLIVGFGELSGDAYAGI